MPGVVGDRLEGLGLDLLEPYVGEPERSSSPAVEHDAHHLFAAVAALRRHPLDRTVFRHVHADLPRAVASFERWLARGSGSVVTPKATLCLGSVARAGRADHVVPSRLQLRRSPLAIPVELELVAWGARRSVVCLRPVDRPWRAPPARRYFPAAHAVMDVLVATLRRDVERL